MCLFHSTCAVVMVIFNLYVNIAIHPPHNTLRHMPHQGAVVGSGNKNQVVERNLVKPCNAANGMKHVGVI